MPTSLGFRKFYVRAALTPTRVDAQIAQLLSLPSGGNFLVNFLETLWETDIYIYNPIDYNPILHVTYI